MSKSFSITLGRPLGAVLLLAGLSTAALGGLGASWADLAAARDERDAKADLLERGIVASQRASRPDLGSAEAADPFVAADTATLAAARVDADLRARAKDAGLALLSSRADAKTEASATDAGIGTRIEVQATVEGQNEALQMLLLAVETGAPVVLVDGLSVQPADVDQAAAGDPQAPRLRMELTLHAYWRSVRP